MSDCSTAPVWFAYVFWIVVLSTAAAFVWLCGTISAYYAALRMLAKRHLLDECDKANVGANETDRRTDDYAIEAQVKRWVKEAGEKNR